MPVYPSGRRFYSKIRLAPGQGGRRTYQLAAGLDQAGAELRDALLDELAQAMRGAGLDVERVIDPKPAKGTRTGAAARSGPSGPSIPRAQRRQTKIELSLSPEAREALDTRAERLGLHRSRVVESLILGAETDALLTPEGSHNLARVARDSGLSAREALRVLLAVDPYLWALLLTAAQRTGGDPGDLIAVGLRQAILAAAKGS